MGASSGSYTVLTVVGIRFVEIHPLNTNKYRKVLLACNS